MAIQWSLVLFTFLAGTACWCFVGVAIDQFRAKESAATFPASLTALILLAAGGIASVTHLSHPTRLIEALSVPTSSIFMEGVGTFVLGALIIVFIILVKREANPLVCKIFAVAGAVVSVALSFIVGNSYIMVNRPAWATMALPFAYVGTAMVMGLAVYAFICALKKEDSLSFFALCTAIAGAISLVTVLVYALCAGLFSMADQALLLWGGVICLGCVVPIILGFLAKKKGAEKSSVCLLGTASLSAVLGGIAFRVIMWNVGVALIDFFEVL